MANQVDLRSRDLRHPEKRSVRFGRGIVFFRIPLWSARAISRSPRCRGVVVGAGRLWAEVRGQDDLAGRRIRSGDRRDDDVIRGRHHLRRDPGAQDDPLTSREAVPKVLRLAPGHHEGEAVARLVGIEVSPADQIAVVARPGRRLVGVVGDKPGRAPIAAGQAVNLRKPPVGEHDLPADVLPVVVRRRRPGADVDEIGRDVRVLRVVGEGHGHLRKGRVKSRRRRDLLQSAARGSHPR